MLLCRARTESLGKQVNVFDEWFHQQIVVVMPSMCQRSFNQMACIVSVHEYQNTTKQSSRVETIQFMEIPQIRKPLRRFHNREMNIQIPIRLLRRANHACQILHSLINLLILFPLQEITRSLNPLRNIRVPEQMIRYRPDIRCVAVRLMPFQLKRIVSPCLLQNIQLIQQRIRVNDLAPPTDEARGRERGIREGDLRVRHSFKQSIQSKSKLHFQNKMFFWMRMRSEESKLKQPRVNLNRESTWRDRKIDREIY